MISKTQKNTKKQQPLKTAIKGTICGRAVLGQYLLAVHRSWQYISPG